MDRKRIIAQARSFVLKGDAKQVECLVLKYQKELPLFGYLFEDACANDQLPIAQLLHKLCSETGRWERSCGDYYNEAFASAAENGHVHILEWLYSLLDDEDDCSYLWAFQVAARAGQVKVLQWLHNTFDLEREEIEDDISQKDVPGPAKKWIHTTYFLS